MFVETMQPNPSKRCIAPQHLKTGYYGALHLEKSWANLRLQTFRGAAAGELKVSPF